jgi:hypothetical protein
MATRRSSAAGGLSAKGHPPLYGPASREHDAQRAARVRILRNIHRAEGITLLERKEFIGARQKGLDRESAIATREGIVILGATLGFLVVQADWKISRIRILAGGGFEPVTLYAPDHGFRMQK